MPASALKRKSEPGSTGAPHARAIAATTPTAIRTLLLLLLLSFLTPLLFLSPMRAPLLAARPAAAAAPPLTVVTLSYSHPHEQRNLAHNCARVSRTRHRFIVYTDDLTPPFCDVCECRAYALRRCACPAGAGMCPRKNPCEKLAFLVSALREHREMVLLDDDLLIMKDFFLDRLALRAQAHDFLASYGHAQGVRNASYWRNFNSGLVFIRRIDGLDYGAMEKRLYETGGSRDQSMLSWFVQDKYSNWDSLSWRWHCRGLRRLEQDIPPEECYTVHGHDEVDQVLKELNQTRLGEGRGRRR